MAAGLGNLLVWTVQGQLTYTSAAVDTIEGVDVEVPTRVRAAGEAMSGRVSAPVEVPTRVAAGEEVMQARVPAEVEAPPKIRAIVERVEP